MIESLEQNLAALRQENARLQKELETQIQKVAELSRDSFLQDLVGRNQLSPEEFCEGCRVSELFMPSDQFAVMAIRLHSDIPFSIDDGTPVNQESLRYVRFLVRNVIEDLVGERNICHVFPVQGELVGLLNLLETGEQGLQSVAEAAQRGAQLFATHYDTAVSFSISGIHSGYGAIPKAYRDAMDLVEYRTMAGDDTTVLRYDHQTENYLPKERVEHFEFEHKLGNHIRSGEYEAARTLVHRMLDAEFSHTRPTVQVYMIRAYGIINDILHVFDSLEEEFSMEFLVELQAGPRIVHAGSLQEITKQLDDIFDAIITRKLEGEPEPQWINRAVSYMDDNFTDQNLNVTSVADAVNINPVYLSRMLKKYRNIRPLEYIHQKRILRAKELLAQGISVKETMTLAGYSSALTMNRAFRRFENATPGAFYREPRR